MSRHFIAAVLTAALTITGISAASADAETRRSNDTAAIIGTAATLFILGAALANAQERDKKKDKKKKRKKEEKKKTGKKTDKNKVTYNHVRPNSDFQRPRGYEQHRSHGHRDGHFAGRQGYGHDAHRRASRSLPASCIRRAYSRDRHPIRVFGARCLKDYSRARRLPSACATQFRAQNGRWREGYHVRCMRRQGFEIAMRR